MATRVLRLALLCTLPGAACIPYAVGQTARTLEPGATTYGQSTFIIPRGFELRSDSTRRYAPRGGSDLELRYGIDETRDVGVRVPSMAGLVVNLKRRLGEEERKVWTAYTVGGGFVNAGDHLYGEFLFHVSASEYIERPITPYGAFRLSHVVPIARHAVEDTPTLGVALGAKIGDSEFSFAPELGFFYDKSALGINSRPFIFVPSLSIVRGRGAVSRGARRLPRQEPRTAGR